MHCNRRQFLGRAASVAFSYAVALPPGLGQGEKRTRLILLGTKGGPRVGEGRSNPSTLLLMRPSQKAQTCSSTKSCKLR